MKIGIYIFLGVLAGILVLGGIGFYVVSRKLKNFSRKFLGTENFMDGINQQADLAAKTPKSVNSMTRLMEPQIMRDFPEFVWEEFRQKAENVLKSALLAISNQNADLLVEADGEVRNQVENRIQTAVAEQYREVFEDVHIHQTEIANYRKNNGKCVITIQSAIEYYYYKRRNDTILEGSKDRKVQTKYNMELVYIQDASVADIDNAVATNCPNCGAPVRTLGHKFCEYCGAGITPINIKVWSLHNFVEVDYYHV